MTLSYSACGEGSPIVFLHGVLGTWTDWSGVINHFPHNRCVSVQFPFEFGDAEERDFSFRSLDELTEYVACIVDELGFDEFVLAGNSLGGQVAIDYALKHPSRVSGLVLSGSAGIEECSVKREGCRFSMNREKLAEYICEVFHDPANCTTELLDRVEEVTKHYGHASFILRVVRESQRVRFHEFLSYIDTPTLLVWGRQDVITPPHVAEDFASRLANSSLVYIDECGHSPPIEKPEEFASAMEEFLTLAKA